MTISMGVIVVAVLLLVGFDGGFSFSPGKPSGGTAQTADVVGGFATAGRVSGFTVLVPKGVPTGWHGSSFSITEPPGTPDAPPTVRGGWLTPSGAYISLIESSGPLSAVLKAELGDTSGAVTGSVSAGGAQWTTSPGVRDEIAWSRSQPSGTGTGITLLITGNASAADFSVMAGTISDSA